MRGGEWKAREGKPICQTCNRKGLEPFAQSAAATVSAHTELTTPPGSPAREASSSQNPGTEVVEEKFVSLKDRMAALKASMDGNKGAGDAAPAPVKTGGFKRQDLGSTNANLCPVCGKRVYSAEEVKGPGGKSWHGLCFCCKVCGKSLRGGQWSEMGGEPACRGCIGKQNPMRAGAANVSGTLAESPAAEGGSPAKVGGSEASGDSPRISLKERKEAFAQSLKATGTCKDLSEANTIAAQAATDAEAAASRAAAEKQAAEAAQSAKAAADAEAARTAADAKAKQAAAEVEPALAAEAATKAASEQEAADAEAKRAAAQAEAERAAAEAEAAVAAQAAADAEAAQREVERAAAEAEAAEAAQAAADAEAAKEEAERMAAGAEAAATEPAVAEAEAAAAEVAAAEAAAAEAEAAAAEAAAAEAAAAEAEAAAAEAAAAEAAAAEAEAATAEAAAAEAEASAAEAAAAEAAAAGAEVAVVQVAAAEAEEEEAEAGAGACSNYTLDLQGKNFGDCKCGFPKTVHNQFTGVADKAPVSRKAPQVPANRKSWSVSASGFSPPARKEAEAEQSGLAGKLCGSYRLDLSGKNFGDCVCGFSKAAHEAKGEPCDVAGAVTEAIEEKGPAAEPCGEYRLDLSGKNFGDCKCGHPKSAHLAGS